MHAPHLTPESSTEERREALQRVREETETWIEDMEAAVEQLSNHYPKQVPEGDYRRSGVTLCFFSINEPKTTTEELRWRIERAIEGRFGGQVYCLRCVGHTTDFGLHPINLGRPDGPRMYEPHVEMTVSWWAPHM